MLVGALGPSRGLLRDCEIFAKVRLKLYCDLISHLAEEQGAVLGAVKLGPVALHQLHPLQRLVQRSEVLLQTLVGSKQGSSKRFFLSKARVSMCDGKMLNV